MPRRSTLGLRLLAGIALALVAADNRAELIKVSPFLPPQNTTSAPTANAPLQYMGWVDTPQGRVYRVYDPARKTGAFLAIGERDASLDVLVKGHDEGRDVLTVEHGGQTLALEERSGKVVSSGMFPGMMQPSAPYGRPVNMLPAVMQSVKLNPTSEDEQKRLEAVAAEVARRRALREQAERQAGMQEAPSPQAPGIMGQQQYRGRRNR